MAQEQAKTAAAASTALMARFTSALQALGVQKKHLPPHTPQQMAKLNNPLRALKSSEQLSVEVKNDLTPKKEGRTITNMAKKRKAADDLAANESGGGAAKRKKITLTASSSEKKNGRGVRAVASPKATVPKRKNAAASASSTTEQRLLSQSAAGLVMTIVGGVDPNRATKQWISNTGDCGDIGQEKSSWRKPSSTCSGDDNHESTSDADSTRVFVCSNGEAECSGELGRAGLGLR